jgi:RHS repeat-associated protein
VYGYSLDASGNRSGQTAGGAGYTHTVSATSNRLTAVQTAGTSGVVNNTITYDAAGNTLSNGRTTAAYSDRGRMRSLTVPNGASTATVSYLYNALEQRTRKSGVTAVVPTGAAYYVYDEQGQLLGEYNASGVPIYEVVWLNDLPVGVIKQTRTGSGTTLNVATRLDYVYADHLNAPRVIARGSPSTDHRIVWRWDSTEPFGLSPANENPNGAGAYSFNLRFPGQVFDRESALHYNWHRDFSPWEGRYTQSDPIGLAGGINTYAYVEGNPLSYVDPEGLQSLTAGGLVRGAVGGGLRGSGGGLLGIGLGVGIGVLAESCKPTEQDREERACDRQYEADLRYCASLASVRGLSRGRRAYNDVYSRCVAAAEEKYVQCYQDAAKP